MILTNECRYTIDELKDELTELGLHYYQKKQLYIQQACAARDYLKDKLESFLTKFSKVNCNRRTWIIRNYNGITKL